MGEEKVGSKKAKEPKTDKNAATVKPITEYFSSNEKMKSQNPKNSDLPQISKKPVKQKAKKEPKPQNKLVTEYFPIRRSDRKTKKQLQKDTEVSIRKVLSSNKDPEFLKVHVFEGKGRGVITTKCFNRGEFVLEYSGELIDPQTSKVRESQYGCDNDIGCYMYYFVCNDKNYCVDATPESGRLGRLVNHSKKGSNLLTKTFMVNDKPRLIFIAKRDIQKNEELLYDYGDRSLSSIQSHPWLAQ